MYFYTKLKNLKSAQVKKSMMMLAVLTLCTSSLTGCIRSKVTISSEPAGAEVVFQGEHRGPTPIEIPIIWYWHYDVKVEKKGYESIEIIERFRTPPWFLMPLDLFMEVLPIPIPDKRERHYILKKKESTVALP